ncbi:MAG TPA: Fic family protein [Verrucomicrobia bacterium]|nr:Fic family protein [Verrucomicrobiota bacterium]
MSYEPKYTITTVLLAKVESAAALRERIRGASVELSWIPALQKETRSRNAHASTAIEGNPLTLEQVRNLEGRETLAGSDKRSQREITNYFSGLRYLEKHSDKKNVRHEDLFELHRTLTDGVMDQGESGCYRTIKVRVGRYAPPDPEMVSGLMFELLEWWNQAAVKLSPILSSAILHYRFESIHPFADGNGRVGRALGLWELYRRGFDTHHVFSVDEFYWEDRQRYYDALNEVRRSGEDLTGWLEYCAEGLCQTLERVWLRILALRVHSDTKLVLRPKQEQLLQLLRARASLAPTEIWAALNVSRQGAMNLMRPLLDAGLMEKVGGKKTGRYILSDPKATTRQQG